MLRVFPTAAPHAEYLHTTHPSQIPSVDIWGSSLCPQVHRALQMRCEVCTELDLCEFMRLRF
jgi:hypothetical protein